MPVARIDYRLAGVNIRGEVRQEFGEVAARHLHLNDGFTLAARASAQLVGILAAYWCPLLPPLSDTVEAYIDIIEVKAPYRRCGIATGLINRAVAQARHHGAYQLRAWSSTDKSEAILMWRKLGFGLCPTTTYPGGQPVSGYFITHVL